LTAQGASFRRSLCSHLAASPGVFLEYLLLAELRTELP
jgi:hypothetical protein